MKRIVLCADDYAMTSGISEGIRRLIRLKRLSATSVMTTGLDFPTGVAPLRNLIDNNAGVSIGLHVTLTGVLPPASGPARWSNSLGSLARDAFFSRLDQGAIKGEIAAQFERFAAAFGRPPDHVDGHQHVHLLPGIRSLVLEATARFAPGAWVRSCAVASMPISAKAALLALASMGLNKALARQGLRGNLDFGGTRSFTESEDVEAMFKKAFLKATDAAVIMCHPGLVDANLAEVDPVTSAREAELSFLESPGFAVFLKESGVELSSMPLPRSEG